MSLGDQLFEGQSHSQDTTSGKKKIYKLWVERQKKKKNVNRLYI